MNHSARWWCGRARVAVSATTLLVIACCTVPTAGRPVTAAADDSLTILQQVFNLPVSGTFSVTLGLPAGIDSTSLGAGAVITVSSHPLIEHGESFAAALRGSLGDVDDTFDVFFDPARADSNAGRPTSDSLSVTVPIATTELSDAPDDDPTATGVDQADDPATDDPATADPPATDPGATSTTQPDTTAPPVAPVATDIVTTGQGDLQFYDAGVHAVEIELSIKNRTVARATTFINIQGPSQTIPDMSVGLVMGQNVQPTVDAHGDVSVTAADTDELGRLADTLAAIDAIPGALGLADTTLPRGVFVQPRTLQAVTDTDPALAARLTQGLVGSAIVSAPELPLEPSAAAAAKQGDQYTKMLSDGEDLLGQLLPRTSIDRNVYLVHQPFTTAAAELQRQIGARLVVMNFPFYNSADGGNGMLTDTSQLVSVALSGDTTVPAAVLDPFLAKRLDDGATDPMLTSIQMVADLLVIAHSIDDDGGDVSRHGMMLGRSDLGVPDAQLTSDLVSLLAATDGLQLVEPNTFESTVTTLLRPGGGGELTVTLPDQQTADLSARVALLNQISTEIVSFASMLPDGAPQVDGWLHVREALPSTAVDDDLAADMVAGLRDDFKVYTAGIKGPDPFTFTLTGRSNTLTFSLSNTTDTDLAVRVRLNSPKLTFPDGDVMVTLPAGEEKEINVRAEALSNGKSSVFLYVYAPAEDSDVQLIPQVVLTARVSSLAGLGQLLTGVGLLLLLTWWGRHWQQTRRKRIAAGNIGRHPSSNGTPPNGTASNGPASNGAAALSIDPPAEPAGGSLSPS